MKEIPLTRGKTAFVDDEDFERLSESKWCFIAGGYAVRGKWIYETKETKVVYMHREIMGATCGQTLDHINRNKLDNRKQNLRFCSMSINGLNKSLQRNNKSGVAGVWFDHIRNKWQARLNLERKPFYIGRFDSFEEACNARQLLIHKLGLIA